MCAVIDPPLFVPIFSNRHSKHHEYECLRMWLISGTGKAVMGGSKYRNELKKVSSVLGLLAELQRRGKIVSFDDSQVDAAASFAKSVGSRDLDDEHLIGLVAVSGCMVVCLDDPRAHTYLKNRALYRPTVRPPKIFSSSRNKNLLGRRYSAACCA
jgi:hypothetical protein